MVLFNNADDNWCSLFSFQHFIWHESVLDFRCFAYVFWHVVYCIVLNANFVIGAFIGGITEIVFALVIFAQSKGMVLKTE